MMKSYENLPVITRTFILMHAITQSIYAGITNCRLMKLKSGENMFTNMNWQCTLLLLKLQGNQAMLIDEIPRGVRQRCAYMNDSPVSEKNQNQLSCWKVWTLFTIWRAQTDDSYHTITSLSASFRQLHQFVWKPKSVVYTQDARCARKCKLLLNASAYVCSIISKSRAQFQKKGHAEIENSQSSDEFSEYQYRLRVSRQQCYWLKAKLLPLSWQVSGFAKPKLKRVVSPWSTHQAHAYEFWIFNSGRDEARFLR